MSQSMAVLLGLNLNGPKSVAYGISGKVQAIDSQVRIQITNGHEKYSFSIHIKIILDEYDFPILLGRAGFFDKFVVIFDQKNERVMLKKRE